MHGSKYSTVHFVYIYEHIFSLVKYHYDSFIRETYIASVKVCRYLYPNQRQTSKREINDESSFGAIIGCLYCIYCYYTKPEKFS